MLRMARTMIIIGFCKRTFTSFIRLLIPMSLFTIVTSSMVFFVLFDVRSSPWVFIPPALLLLSVVNVVVVKYSGRPLFEIPRVFRGRSEEELLQWLAGDIELDRRPAGSRSVRFGPRLPMGSTGRSGASLDTLDPTGTDPAITGEPPEERAPHHAGPY